MKSGLKHTMAALLAAVSLIVPSGSVYAEPSGQVALPAEESQQETAPAPLDPDAEAGMD